MKVHGFHQGDNQHISVIPVRHSWCFSLRNIDDTRWAEKNTVEGENELK